MQGQVRCPIAPLVSATKGATQEIENAAFKILRNPAKLATLNLTNIPLLISGGVAKSYLETVPTSTPTSSSSASLPFASVSSSST